MSTTNLDQQEAIKRARKGGLNIEDQHIFLRCNGRLLKREECTLGERSYSMPAKMTGIITAPDEASNPTFAIFLFFWGWGGGRGASSDRTFGAEGAGPRSRGHCTPSVSKSMLSTGLLSTFPNAAPAVTPTSNIWAVALVVSF